MTASPDTIQKVEPALPPEWQAELDLLEKGSPEYADFVSALGELGLAAAEVTQPDLGEPPSGFVSWRTIPDGSRLPSGQFDGKVAGLGNGAEVITTDVLELVTDAGNTVRVSDLRANMSSPVRKLGPKSTREQDKLDRAFFRDIKVYADTGLARNTVTDVAKGVNYTRAGDTSMRTYWTPVQDKGNTEKVRAVARLADSGDNKGMESKLYHRIFGAQL